jgi:hypothetical protein
MLGKRRVHVVENGDGEDPPEEDSYEARFLVAIQEIVALDEKPLERAEKNEGVEWDLRERGPDAHVPDSGNASRP